MAATAARLDPNELSEMAERLAKAERIAERERLHRADMERELIKTGWGSRVKNSVRSPRRDMERKSPA